jgi:ParB-like chromosome segregation protein Spo0J
MRALGWSTVPAWVVDLPNIIRGALAENAQRKDFLPSEIDAIRRSLEPIEKATAKQRQREHGRTAPGKHSAKISQSVKPVHLIVLVVLAENMIRQSASFGVLASM